MGFVYGRCRDMSAEGYGRVVTVEKGSVRLDVAPDLGFSLVRFLWNGVDILDRRTEQGFIRARKGLGPLIMPHFNQFADLPVIDENAFPHVEQLRNLGVAHPFQHGVARYLPWRYEAAEASVTGEFSSDSHYRGHLVRDLAGFRFRARVSYRIVDDGITIEFDVEGEKPIAAGTHFYYDVVDKQKASVSLSDAFTPAPDRLRLDQPINEIYYVRSDVADHEASATLTTSAYRLTTTIRVGGPSERSFESVVIFCPPEGRFVCVEPISYAVGHENVKTRFRADIRLQLGARG